MKPTPATVQAGLPAHRHAAAPRPTRALVHTTLRGAVVGFVALGLLLPVCTLALWGITPTSRLISALAAFKIMAGAPFFGAMLAGISTALLVSMWVLMRRQAVARLAPGALRQLRRSMAVCLLPLWAWLALPAVASALQLAASVQSPEPGAVPATWALVLYAAGLPALGMAVALGLMVLVRLPWLRTVLGLGPLLLILGLNQIDLAQLHALPGRDGWMAGSGAVGLAAAAWTAARTARWLSLPAALHTAATAPAGLAGWQLGGNRSTPARRWQALLLPAVTATWRDAAVMVPGLVLLVWWFQHAHMGWNVGVMLMACLVANAAAPWTMGTWASPRLALLPGGLHRQGLAWTVWRHVMARGMVPVALVGVLLLAMAVPVLQPQAVDVAATVLLGASCAWFVGSVSVAVLPWCKSSMALRMSPWGATAAFAAIALAVAFFNFSGSAMTVSTLAWAGTSASISVPLAVLMLAMSARAWARYDWSRMPATAPMMDMLLKQAARSA
jgi:hypothetical protein